MTHETAGSSGTDENTDRADQGFPEELSVVVGTDPAPLVASPNDGEPNYAALRVLITNVSDSTSVTAHKIKIQLKVTKDNNPQADLLSESWLKRGNTITRKAETREASSDDTGGYEFTYFGEKSGSPFEPGESIALFINKIPVSAAPGATSVEIGVKPTNSDGDDFAWKSFPIGKFPTGYYLKDLRADVNPVDYWDPVILTWQAPPIEGISYELYANSMRIPLNPEHPQPVHTDPLTTDTTFELVPSWSTEVVHRQRLLVRVIGGDVAAHSVIVNGYYGIYSGGEVVASDVSIRGNNTVE